MLWASHISPLPSDTSLNVLLPAPAILWPQMPTILSWAGSRYVLIALVLSAHAFKACKDEVEEGLFTADGCCLLKDYQHRGHRGSPFLLSPWLTSCLLW